MSVIKLPAYSRRMIANHFPRFVQFLVAVLIVCTVTVSQPVNRVSRAQQISNDSANVSIFLPIVTRDFPSTRMLATQGETITWTQTMALSEGTLTFQVVNGQSQTWGSFGSESEAIALSTRLSNLNGYNPMVSIGNSGVSFASNLVTSLTLKSIRWYNASGVLLWEFSVPLVVHPKP